jgi:hypothetical protein
VLVVVLMSAPVTVQPEMAATVRANASPARRSAVPALCLNVAFKRKPSFKKLLVNDSSKALSAVCPYFPRLFKESPFPASRSIPLIIN